MSHDRGCMRCGSYGLNYANCEEEDCPKQMWALPMSVVTGRILQRFVGVLDRAGIKHSGGKIFRQGDFIYFRFRSK